MNNISSMNLGCKDRLTTVGSGLPTPATKKRPCGLHHRDLVSSSGFNCYSQNTEFWMPGQAQHDNHWSRASRSAKSLFLPSALLLSIKYSTFWALNNSSSSLKSLGISINLPSQKIYSSQPLFGRPAQPILKVLLYFIIGVQAMLVYRSSNHNIHYTELTTKAKHSHSKITFYAYDVFFSKTDLEYL